MNDRTADLVIADQPAAVVRGQIRRLGPLRAAIERGEVIVNTELVAALVDLESYVRYTLLEANKCYNRAHPRRGKATGRPR